MPIELLRTLVCRAPFEYGYALYAEHAASSYLAAYITNGTAAASSVTASSEPPPTAWTHLATTFDGVTLRVYVNGSLVKTEPVSEVEIGKSPLTIGSATLFGETSYLDGRIDELRIYNRALGAAEVEADKEAPIQTPHARPVAAYSFNEGTGTVAHDVSGNPPESAHDGALSPEGVELTKNAG